MGRALGILPESDYIWIMKKILKFAILLLSVFVIMAPVSCEKRENREENKETQDPTEDKTDPDPTEGGDEVKEEPWFITRGLCLSWYDVNKADVIDYVDIAKNYGLNTFSIFNYTDLSGYKKRCTDAGIDIEYEEHALSRLLPPSLFSTHPEYFHMGKDGKRAVGNGCPSNSEALAIIKKNVPTAIQNRKPTNHKYYFWLDDGGDVCHCSSCKHLNASDQALIFENEIIKELKKIDPEAILAHLAYVGTWAAPVKVKPEQGIFLEFAPFHRNYVYPLSKANVKGTTGVSHGQYMSYLSDNLRVFSRETAQVLEYWCDESPYCNWSYSNLKKLPWYNDTFLDDLDTYASMGIRHIMCYAAYVGPDYVNKFGFPQFIVDYATGLRDYVKK